VINEPHVGKSGRDGVQLVRRNNDLAGTGALLGRKDIGLVAKNK
jgi:hypothetical protein